MGQGPAQVVRLTQAGHSRAPPSPPSAGDSVRPIELLQHSISLHALRYSYVGREGEDKSKRWSVEAPRPAWAQGSSAVHVPSRVTTA